MVTYFDGVEIQIDSREETIEFDVFAMESTVGSMQLLLLQDHQLPRKESNHAALE